MEDGEVKSESSVDDKELLSLLDEDSSGSGDERVAQKKYLGRYDNVEDLEKHAKHFQSKADKLENELESIKNSKAYKLIQDKLSDDEGVRKLESILENEGIEDEPPAYIDVSEINNPDTPSGKWFKKVVVAYAKPVIDKMSKVEEAKAEASRLLSVAPELADDEVRVRFSEFVREKQNSGAVLPLVDFYRLWVSDNAHAQESSASLPSGIGGGSSKTGALTNEEREALLILKGSREEDQF